MIAGIRARSSYLSAIDVPFVSRPGLKPDRNVALREILFHVADSMGPEMEDAGRKRSVRLAFHECFVHMLGLSCAARGDHRYRHGLRDGARELKVVSLLRAVCVHAGDQNFAGARLSAPSRPFNGVDLNGRSASYPAVCVYLPPALCRPLGVDGDDDAL